MTDSEHISPVAIVTGGSRGFGRAVAAALLDRGWTVVADARRADDLEATAAELASPRLITVPGDVTEPAHRAALRRRRDRLRTAAATGEQRQSARS